MVGFSDWAAIGLASVILQTAAVPEQGQAAPPQQVQDQTPPTPVDDIEVRADPLPAAVRDFVDQITVPIRQRGSARWNGLKVCVGAVNMRSAAAHTLVDHISSVAADFGLEPGDPGCQPNVLVIGADDGAAMADGMAAARPHAFRIGSLQADQGSAAFARFRTSDAPVRWWQISAPTDSYTGQPTIRFRGHPPPTIAISSKSEMRRRIRDDLKRVIVIVDFNRADGMTFNQLGDYIAMVAFAQIDPEADTSGYRTVLNLFDTSGQERVDGLTDWDRAYLTTLYGYGNERIVPSRQAEAMTAALRSAETPGD